MGITRATEMVGPLLIRNNGTGNLGVKQHHVLVFGILLFIQLGL